MISRRSLLRTGAASGLAALALPGLVGRARAQGAGHLRVIHASPATLVLWSVTYLAEDMGFYTEEGLTIERLPLNGGPVAMTALVAGEGDLQVATPGEALSAVSRGQDIRILESYTATDAYSLCVGKTFAEAKGLKGREIFLRYALRNALLPQVTALALSLGYIVSGAVLVEVVFGYPGVGTVLYQAIRTFDYFVIYGVVMMLILAIGLATLVMDLIYPLLDPRITYQGR